MKYGIAEFFTIFLILISAVLIGGIMSEKTELNYLTTTLLLFLMVDSILFKLIAEYYKSLFFN